MREGGGKENPRTAGFVVGWLVGWLRHLLGTPLPKPFDLATFVTVSYIGRRGVATATHTMSDR